MLNLSRGAFSKHGSSAAVFVFDQIDKLFVKPENKDAKDAGGLAFPFVLAQGVMKLNRITSAALASCLGRFGTRRGSPWSFQCRLGGRKS